LTAAIRSIRKKHIDKIIKKIKLIRDNKTLKKKEDFEKVIHFIISSVEIIKRRI